MAALGIQQSAEEMRLMMRGLGEPNGGISFHSFARMIFGAAASQPLTSTGHKHHSSLDDIVKQNEQHGRLQGTSLVLAEHEQEHEHKALKATLGYAPGLPLDSAASLSAIRSAASPARGHSSPGELWVASCTP